MIRGGIDVMEKPHLVLAVSSRALFNLERENDIFHKEGLEGYTAYQQSHEEVPLQPGAGFRLVKALLKLNDLDPEKRITEIIIMSRNSADNSLRIFNSIKHYNLDITRAVLTGGAPIAPYLSAFETDLFLSADEEDVQAAINAGFAAGIIYTDPKFDIDLERDIEQINIAFDGDAVLFSDESERIFKEHGFDKFTEHETTNAKKLLADGPFAKLLRKLAFLQAEFTPGTAPLRLALVTARNAPAHERVIRTLRAWDIRIDEAFFLGGMDKSRVLKAFNAHIFFDDQKVHSDPASQVVPSARVPYKQEKN